MKANDAVGSPNWTSNQVTPREKTYPLPEFTQNELLAVVEAIEIVFREQNFISPDEKSVGLKIAAVLLVNNLVSSQYAQYLLHTYGPLT